jgi:HEAT repeat protein
MRPRILAVVAALAAFGGTRAALADRLGGNYRGPGDVAGAREDPAPDKPDLPGGKAPEGNPPEGGGEREPPPEGGEDGEPPAPPEPGYGDGYRHPASDVPGDSRQPEDPPPPSDSEDGGTAPPPPKPAPMAPGAKAREGGDSGSGGGSSGASLSQDRGGSLSGKGPPEDKDRTWTFYFEGAREEYLSAALARRPEPRISPPGTSTWVLSLQPPEGSGRRPVDAADRTRAERLVLARLRDAEPRVRDAAVLALGKSGSAGAVPWIAAAAVSDPDPAIREDALLALGLAGSAEEALPVLREALSSPPGNGKGRRAAYAALGLGLLGDPEAARPLRSLFEASFERPELEEEAAASATALGMLGDPLALPFLERALASRAATLPVRCAALHALGKYGLHPDERVRRSARALAASALRGPAEIRQSALLALGAFPDEEAIALLARDGLLDPDPCCRTFAAHSLGRIAGREGPDSRAHAFVARELEAASGSAVRDRWLFQAGTVALGGLAPAGFEPSLLERGGDRRLDPNSSSSVVLSLGLLGPASPEAGARIRGAFGTRSSGESVRAYAGLALGLAAPDGASEALAEAVRGRRGSPADVSRNAALALGLVGGAREADLLVEVLRSESLAGADADGRYFLMGASVQGLGLIADGDTVGRLEPLLASPRWPPRAFATAALGYLLETDPARRVSPRISGIFRHYNYRVSLPLVRAVQSTL